MTNRKIINMKRLEEELADLLDLEDGDRILNVNGSGRGNSVTFTIERND